MQPPFIMVAPNGARRTKADHPKLPITLPETIETARQCHLAGAQGLHLHVRDDHGNHSIDVGRYREALAELSRTVPNMIIQVTTESAGRYETSEQLACLRELCPKYASVSVREIARAPELVDQVYGLCAAEGIEVQHILYNLDDIRVLRQWQDNGTVRPHQDNVILVAGQYSNHDATSALDVQALLQAGCAFKRRMICAFGKQEHEILTKAARQGCDLRVGFENSLHGVDGVVHKDNAASVKALIDHIKRIET